MDMSHHGPVKPYHAVTLLWFEPGGCSLVPRSLRAAVIMPCTVPMSRLQVFGKGVDVSGHHVRGVLADAVLAGIDIKDSRASSRVRRCLIAVGHARFSCSVWFPGRSVMGRGAPAVCGRLVSRYATSLADRAPCPGLFCRLV